MALAGEAGFTWVASGQAVLRNSLDPDEPGVGDLYRPYRVEDGSPACFFRDEGLADRIGSVYRDWKADDAVAALIGRPGSDRCRANGRSVRGGADHPRW